MSAALGKIIKEIDPEYEDMSDHDLGQRILDKIQNDPNFLFQLLDVQSKYDPSLGRIQSWWVRGKSESRSKLLAQLMQEGAGILGLIQQRLALEDLFDQQELKRIQREYDIESFQTQIHEQRYKQAEIMTNAVLLKNAAEHQMDLATFIEYRKKIAFDKADIDADAQEAINRIRLAQIAEFMTDHTQIDILQKSLDVLYVEVYQIASGREPDEVKKRKIESREKTIRTKEKDKAAIEQRLLQAHNRPNRKRANKNTKPPNDPR